MIEWIIIITKSWVFLYIRAVPHEVSVESKHGRRETKNDGDDTERFNAIKAVQYTVIAISERLPCWECPNRNNSFPHGTVILQKVTMGEEEEKNIVETTLNICYEAVLVAQYTIIAIPERLLCWECPNRNKRFPHDTVTLVWDFCWWQMKRTFD